MSIWRLRRAVLALAAVTLAVPAAVAVLAPASAASTRARAARPAPEPGAGLRPACPQARAGYFACFVMYRPQARANRAIAAGIAGRASRPAGLTPEQIQAAYRLPVSRHSHQTVAVSIAFDTPHLAKYLATYRQYFGLSPCTVKSGCLRKVNQHGNSNPKRLPPSGAGSGWDLEATLDVSMISVACPHCKIVVVEAKDPSLANLARTDDTAAALGAQVISNSYGTRENGFALAFSRAYHHPGHTIVVASGDLGYAAANFPADLPTVTAAGGTMLARAPNNRGWQERVWFDPLNGAGGSGCSAYIAKPAWQHDRHCPGRTVADVAAVAANIPIYNKDYGGWVTVGGTSVAAPLIAGIYGLAGNASTIRHGYAYTHRRDLFDITRGANALIVPSRLACGNDYLCVARKGYDAPTGLGTPNGLGAF
jgi:hypothetical protein